MIKTKRELADFLKLDFLMRAYPTPSRGNGEDVAEIHNTYSWVCVLQAAKALTDNELNEVLNFREQISFHNNSISGYGSVGQNWTIGYFLWRNGDSELRKRLKNIGIIY